MKTFSSRYELNATKGAENRLNGHAFEHRVMRKMKKRPRVLNVTHSAGSYGLVDIISIFPNKIVCTVCKRNGYMPPKERRELEHFIELSPDNIEVEFVYYISERKMKTIIMKKAG